MRDTDFRRFFQAAALAAAIAIAPSVAVAQAANDPAPVQTTDDTDDDTDLGWLGLLGLAGLLGLRRRDTHVHHTDTTTRRP